MAVDILIIAVVAAGGLYGFWRGIIGQIGQMAAVAVGIVAARIFGERLTHFFAGDGEPGVMDYASGYIIVFICAFLLTWLIARLIKKTVAKVHLGMADRLAGAVFKAALWTFILSLGLNVYLLVKGDSHAIDDSGKPWRSAAVKFAPSVLGFLNQEIKSN